ncbi:hypothetical protein BDV93DRAFT_520030 [Ceratobasidium sp. AG-I]|nr:hypothetical protein BDV93DRAFT_520030 [Ceratobasidium sp. AG-I]
MWVSNDWFYGNQAKRMIVLQTSHIIDYNLGDLRRVQHDWHADSSIFDKPQLVKSMVQLNCTKRHNGLPHDGAIPTGGQLTRVSQFNWPESFMRTIISKRAGECLVWSSQSFAEGEYDEVCNTPLVGPRRIAHKKPRVT